ncbi:MAG TPA: hypothetical protein VLF89_04100 [Candidatus Saccharimonadales bacterium]|nr:hypothetical protein [Candidatus Saccharimonadales bacterium]
MQKILKNKNLSIVEETTKRGGKRKGAGRKPIKDKKKPFVVWLRPSDIKRCGGKNKVMRLLYDAVGC